MSPGIGRFRDGRSMPLPGDGNHPANLSRTYVSLRRFWDGNRDDQFVSTPAVFDNSVRIGYARVSTRA